MRITACAVSQMADIDQLPGLEGFEDFFVEPNQKWLENPANEQAWVKVYRNLYGKINSVSKTTGQVQVIEIPIPFLGESYKECWAEVQIMIKRTIVRNHKSVRLESVQLGRHQSYDPRVNRWVKETKPIAPKKDAGTHGYITLRFYHQDHLPVVPSDYHFEPLYVLIASDAFYRIEALWQNEEIKIIITPLDKNSPEIPKLLR